ICFFFQAEDGIRDRNVTGVQTCALPIFLVTHDVEEAVAISDRVVLIENGVISWNQPIHLPRPRRRTDPTFSTYVKDILDQIMGRTTPSTYGLNHAKTVDKTS